MAGEIASGGSGSGGGGVSGVRAARLDPSAPPCVWANGARSAAQAVKTKITC
jgi:hypothetical protein